MVPATSEPTSNCSTRLSSNGAGTSPSRMRCASPSTIAVLPTPGSPIKAGLFFVRRARIWITRSISMTRPITGSSFPSSARVVRSVASWSTMGVFAFACSCLPPWDCPSGGEPVLRAALLSCKTRRVCRRICSEVTPSLRKASMAIPSP